MQNRPIKHESLLYLLAFTLAITLRLTNLGTLSLGNTEAEWALQAFSVAQGNRPLLGPQPAYILPTSLLFFLFGTSNFLARLIPVLAGIGLIFVPYMFRTRLKPIPSLLLTFFLVLDPGLVSLSRQAGSLMPALSSIFLTWAFWYQKRPRALGIFAGLALLSGSSVWAGLLSLGLALGLKWIFELPFANDKDQKKIPSEKAKQNFVSALGDDLKKPLIYIGATLLLGGTLFLLAPNGLSAWLNSLPVYLASWFQPSGVPASRLLFALLVYQPFALVFGLLAIVRGWWQEQRARLLLSLWFITGLILAMVYPARQVSDLVWALVPLWVLAAFELSSHSQILLKKNHQVAWVATLVVILLTFSWLVYAGIAINPNSAATNAISFGGVALPPTPYISLISVLLLLVVSILLIALGWSTQLARLGLVWGLTIAVGIYSLGISWGATGLRTSNGWELWWPEGRFSQADLVLRTVNDQSEWSTGHAHSQEVTLLELESPSLEWLLRDRKVTTVSTLDIQEAPAIVISTQNVGLNLTTAYRGQDFVWRQEPAWELLTRNDWIKWSVFREMRYHSETIIVWVRNDLFLDTSGSFPQ